LRPARFIVEAVMVFCPYCKEIIPEAGGSEFWTRDDLRMVEQIKCFNCKRDVRLPRPKTVRMFF
jgi:Zn ribbon nucleic-acid-binding protein